MVIYISFGDFEIKQSFNTFEENLHAKYMFACF